MADDNTAYRAVAIFVIVVGVGATIVGFGGLYVVLTGGTTDGTAGTEALGAYECAAFDGDPEVGHDSTYEVEQTLVGDSRIESFEASSNATELRIEIVVAGELLDASASRADGTAVPVQQRSDERRVVIAEATPAPLRVWIDSLSEDAVVTRTRLEVCPPE
jgi:hypothetical protein